MTNLNKLLEGVEVEWKPLGEVAELNRGKTITAKTKNEGNIPVISGGQTPAYYNSEFNRDGETITIAGSGAYSGFVMYWNEPIFVSDAFSVKPDLTILNVRYVFHFLLSNQTWIHNLQKGSGVPHVYPKDLAKLEIPIPCPDNPKKSLEIQNEIVRILDAFTELTAELTARKKQYNYYRNQLLSFEDGEVEWKPLRDVAEYSNDRISFEKLDKNNYVGVDNLLQNREGKTISTYVPQSGNSTKYNAGDILIGNIRPYLKKIWHADRLGGTNGDVLVIHLIDKKIISRFLYHILADDKFFLYNMQNAKGAKMPRGNKGQIMEYIIPVPSPEEQKRIVSILDKFDTLPTSISEGLPKEIELRKKQYEYYRNSLLTFDRI